MDSGFQSLTGFWISWAVFWIPQAKIFAGILHFTNKNFPHSFTWGDSIVRLRALLARILSFNFKILYLTKIMIKRQPRRKEWKRVIPLWNVIWKVFLKSQLRKRSWKKISRSKRISEKGILFFLTGIRVLYHTSFRLSQPFSLKWNWFVQMVIAIIAGRKFTFSEICLLSLNRAGTDRFATRNLKI